MDWTEALKAFRDANPDLPEGSEQATSENNAKPTLPRLDISYERKGRAGKPATIISGFTCDDNELRSIASTIKTKMGTGGSARGKEILVQGDRREQAAGLLKEMGYKIRIL